MGRAPMWCHARGAALTLVLALACLSAVRALSSDVLAVGDLAASANGKRFPVVGTPRTFPRPTVTDAVRLGTLRERAFPSRADAAGAPGAGADAFPADAGGPVAREDAGGMAESVVEDVVFAEEETRDASAAATAEDAEDACLTPRGFETAALDPASATASVVPVLVAAAAVSASAALAIREAVAGAARAAAAAAAFAASAASRCLGVVAGSRSKNRNARFRSSAARTETAEPVNVSVANARTLRSLFASRAETVRVAERRAEDQETPPAAATRQVATFFLRRRASCVTVHAHGRRGRDSTGSAPRRATRRDAADAAGAALSFPAKTPSPRRSTRLRKAARASPTSHFEGPEASASSGSSADESPAFDSEEDGEERPGWRVQMAGILRAVGKQTTRVNDEP